MGGVVWAWMTNQKDVTHQVKLHYWTSGGAQSVVVPLDQEVQRHRLLLAEGAVVLKREDLGAA